MEEDYDTDDWGTPADDLFGNANDMGTVTATATPGTDTASGPTPASGGGFFGNLFTGLTGLVTAAAPAAGSILAAQRNPAPATVAGAIKPAPTTVAGAINPAPTTVAGAINPATGRPSTPAMTQPAGGSSLLSGNNVIILAVVGVLVAVLFLMRRK